MLDLCLAPLFLAGYLHTLPVPTKYQTNVDAAVVEIQSCETGPGVHAKATSSGLYGVGIQYGLTWHPTPRTSMTFQPRGGLSYADHPVRELPQQTQMEVGAQVLLGLDQYRVAVEYWHLSNAGMRQPNIGLNMLIFMGGITF